MSLKQAHREIPYSVRLIYAHAICQHLALRHKWGEAHTSSQACALARGDWGADLSDATCCETSRYSKMLDLIMDRWA